VALRSVRPGKACGIIALTNFQMLVRLIRQIRAVPKASVPMLLQVAENSSNFGKSLVNQNRRVSEQAPAIASASRISLIRPLLHSPAP